MHLFRFQFVALSFNFLIIPISPNCMISIVEVRHGLRLNVVYIRILIKALLYHVDVKLTHIQLSGICTWGSAASAHSTVEHWCLGSLDGGFHAHPCQLLHCTLLDRALLVLACCQALNVSSLEPSVVLWVFDGLKTFIAVKDLAWYPNGFKWIVLCSLCFSWLAAVQEITQVLSGRSLYFRTQNRRW
mgnify:CR=1 FL=1